MPRLPLELLIEIQRLSTETKKDAAVWLAVCRATYPLAKKALWRTLNFGARSMTAIPYDDNDGWRLVRHVKWDSRRYESKDSGCAEWTLAESNQIIFRSVILPLCTSLTSLDLAVSPSLLDSNPPTTVILPHVRKVSVLVLFAGYETRLSRPALARFLATMPNIANLSIVSYTRKSDDLAHLPDLPRLRKLTVNDSSWWYGNNDWWMPHDIELLPFAFNSPSSLPSPALLTHLTLASYPDMVLAMLPRLSTLPHLAHLDMWIGPDDQDYSDTLTDDLALLLAHVILALHRLQTIEMYAQLQDGMASHEIFEVMEEDVMEELVDAIRVGASRRLIQVDTDLCIDPYVGAPHRVLLDGLDGTGIKEMSWTYRAPGAMEVSDWRWIDGVGDTPEPGSDQEE